MVLGADGTIHVPGHRVQPARNAAGVDADLAADGSAEQLPDRDAEAFALQVPEGAVDGGDGAVDDGTAAPAGVEVAPDEFDRRGVAAEQVGRELLDDGGDGAAAIGSGAFAPAEQAFVGGNADEEPFAPAHVFDDDFDSRDLHALARLER